MHTETRPSTWISANLAIVLHTSTRYARHCQRSIECNIHLSLGYEPANQGQLVVEAGLLLFVIGRVGGKDFSHAIRSQYNHREPEFFNPTGQSSSRLMVLLPDVGRPVNQIAIPA